MADDHDERVRQHEEMLRSLTAMLVRLDGSLATQAGINERLTLAIERIDWTLAHVESPQARMETLLACMIRTEDNGREA